MMKKFLFFMVSLVFVILLGFNKKNPSIIIGCTAELTMMKNIGVNELKNKLNYNMNVNLFFYDNNKGFALFSGVADFSGQRYLINREVRFSYTDLDNDGLHTLKYTKIVKGHSDTTTEHLWANILDVSRNLYISLNQLPGDVYLIKSLQTPEFVCNKT